MKYEPVDKNELSTSCRVVGFWCLILLIGLCLANITWGHEYAVVRVSVADANDPLTSQSGSGVLVETTETHSTILTAGHVLEGGNPNAIAVHYRNGKRLKGKLLGFSNTSGKDLGLVTTAPVDIVPAVINDKKPSGKMRLCGFGGLTVPDLKYKFRALPSKYRDDFGGNARFAGTARQGDSGGPILNERNEVVAVLWGTQGGLTWATAGVTLTQFCNRYGCCPGGNCKRPRIEVRPVPQPVPGPPIIPIPDKPNPVKPPEHSIIGCDCDEKLKALEDRIALLEARQPEKGDAGPEGPTGPQGPPGDTVNIDISSIVQKVIAAIGDKFKPKPFYMRVHPSAPYQEVNPGQYVTLPIQKTQE